MINEVSYLSVFTSLFLDVMIVYYAYSGKFYKKVFVLVIFYSFSTIFDVSATLVVLFFYSIIQPNVLLSNEIIVGLAVPATIVSKLILLFGILLVRNALKSDNNLTYWIRYLPVPLFTIVAILWGSPFSMDMIDTELFYLLAIVCIFSIFSNIYLIILILRTSEKLFLKKRVELQKEYLQRSKETFLQYRAANMQLERTRHDFKYHINYLLALSSVKEIHDYLLKVHDRNFIELLKFTGNFDVDCVLNFKLSEMNHKNVHLQINNKLPLTIDWIDPVDMNIILGNALSNALEAVEQCEDKKIEIAFMYDGDFLIITMENETSKAPKLKNDGSGFISTKQGEGHGIGMESITESIKNYNGHIKYKLQDKTITLDILLQKPNYD